MIGLALDVLALLLLLALAGVVLVAVSGIAGGVVTGIVYLLGFVAEGAFRLPRLFGVSAERMNTIRDWINNGQPSFTKPWLPSEGRTSPDAEGTQDPREVTGLQPRATRASSLSI